MTPRNSPRRKPNSDAYDAARAALKSRDYATAVTKFEEHLQAHPDDMEAQMERGLAHLMAGNEDHFVAVHDAVAPRLEASPPNTRHLNRLWLLYRSLIKKIAKAAAVVAIASLPMGAMAGCPKNGPDTTPENRPSPTATVDAGTPAPTPDAAAQRPPPPPPPEPDAAAPVTKPQPPPPVYKLKYRVVKPRYRVIRPMYRYGIRRPRKP